MRHPVPSVHPIFGFSLLINCGATWRTAAMGYQSYAHASTSRQLLASNTAMRITRDPFFADILRDARIHFELWHWIVLRDGSNQIFGMGQERTEKEAADCAEQCIVDLM